MPIPGRELVPELAITNFPVAMVSRRWQFPTGPQASEDVADMPGDISSMLPGEAFIGFWS